MVAWVMHIHAVSRWYIEKLEYTRSGCQNESKALLGELDQFLCQKRYRYSHPWE